MSREARAAVQHFRKTGNLYEAMDGLLRRQRLPSLVEQTQRWFIPDQDKANRVRLMAMDKLGLSVTVKPTDQGNQGGYELTITGDYADHDIASLTAGMGGVMRLDNQPAEL